MYNKKVEPYPITQLTEQESKNFDNSKFHPVNIFDFFDKGMMQTFHFSEQEYDKFCEGVTEEEMDIIFKQDKTYSEAKQVVLILNKFRNG